MVGVPCTIFALIICALLTNDVTATTTTTYRNACIELSTAISCVNRSLDDFPANLPGGTQMLNLNNNNIQQVNRASLKDLSKLEVLKLNKNQIKSLHKDNFGHLPKLKILELNRNQMEHIMALSFQHLEKVSVLKLRHNKIRNLPDGTFYGLNGIRQLQLDYNAIGTIKKSWLYSLDNLTILSLSNNRISSIDTDAWEFCKGLVDLDLSSNQLKTIRRDAFRQLTSLKMLNLDSNDITNIEDSAFTHAPLLLVLNLNNNRVSWSVEDPNGVYKGLNNLRNLSIAGNEIKSINRYAFAGLAQLRYLDVDGNNITSIQMNAFKELPQLEALALNTTSLLCDCNLQWFYDFLRVHQFNVTTVCTYPDALHGTPLLDVPANNFTCDNLTKPRLIDEPGVEIMALKDEDVALQCRAVSSSPSQMLFKWKKDNVELPNAEMSVAMSQNGNHTESVSFLHLKHVQHADAGKYQCVVANAFGTTYSTKSTISVLIYPTFAKRPRNITVHAGMTAKLVCSASGEPPPEIAWQKDGGNDFPAARERRMQVMPADDVFFIINAKPSDMGVYSCTARNSAGRIVANATLNIEEKPTFVKPMENRTVKMGESVVIQCIASGAPKPSIHWYKENVPIVPTERHFFTAEEQLMIIVDSVLTDAGNYTCKLNNSLGSEIGHSTIVVKPGNMPFSDMLGIIIITVVSCAVFTSFVWVIIIYQTRKRMNAASMRNIHDTMMIDFSDKLAKQHYGDNTSEHSSCKDSGTGDSAKRSNDDLMPPEEITLIINNEANHSSSLRTASLVYLPPGGDRSTSNSPLLPPNSKHKTTTFTRSTNHDRLNPIDNNTTMGMQRPIEVYAEVDCEQQSI